MLTPVEVEQLKELLNKGKGDGKHWDLNLSFEEYMKFRVLLAKVLDPKDADLYQEYIYWRQVVLQKWQRELELEASQHKAAPPPRGKNGGKHA